MQDYFRESSDITKTEAKHALSKIYREQKRLAQQSIEYYAVLSTPESKQKKNDLEKSIVKQQNNLLDNELNRENLSSIQTKDLKPDELAAYTELKNDKMNCSSVLITELKNNKSFKELHKHKVIDMRKQRHKSTPSTWLDNIATRKLAFDIESRLNKLENEVKHDREVQRLEREENNRKFKAIGMAIINVEAGLQDVKQQDITLDDKLEFLKSIGVKHKKIELFRLKEENKDLPKQTLAKVLGVTRPTVYNWLSELDELVCGLEHHKPETLLQQV